MEQEGGGEREENQNEGEKKWKGREKRLITAVKKDEKKARITREKTNKRGTNPKPTLITCPSRPPRPHPPRLKPLAGR